MQFIRSMLNVLKCKNFLFLSIFLLYNRCPEIIDNIFPLKRLLFLYLIFIFLYFFHFLLIYHVYNNSREYIRISHFKIKPVFKSAVATYLWLYKLNIISVHLVSDRRSFAILLSYSKYMNVEAMQTKILKYMKINRRKIRVHSEMY